LDAAIVARDLLKMAEGSVVGAERPQPLPQFDFSQLNDAADLLAAQRRVLETMGNGLISPSDANSIIGMLDALRRSHADVVTEERLLNYEETREQVEASLRQSAYEQPQH
jgi:hypothetical protein